LFISTQQVRSVSGTASAITPIEDGRSELRTHIFVGATLWSDDGSVPVSIRNMSPTGALLDSPVLPQPGTTVVLKRGSLEIAGRIAWQAGRRGGVAFFAIVCVDDWISRKAADSQARVDRIVSEYRAGSPSPMVAADAEPSPGNMLTADLLALRAELAQLGMSLIGDVVLVANHPEIQALDIAVQRIDRMIGQLDAKG
jgi:hypothetical protein